MTRRYGVAMRRSATQRRTRWLLRASCLTLVLAGCTTPDPLPVDDDDDDDSTQPGLGDPDCSLQLTNHTGMPLSSMTTATSEAQLDGVELLAEALPDGATVTVPLEPRAHHLVGLTPDGAYYAVGWILCIWDEELTVAVEDEHFVLPGLRVDNGTSEALVSLELSPVGALQWSENLLGGDPIPSFGRRDLSLDPGTWYAMVRNEQGLGYLANFVLMNQPPQFELSISRLQTVEGEPCTWGIANRAAMEVVGVSFTGSGGMFFNQVMPMGVYLEPDEAIDGVLPPDDWSLTVFYIEGSQFTPPPFTCVSGEHFEWEAAP